MTLPKRPCCICNKQTPLSLRTAKDEFFLCQAHAMEVLKGAGF